MNGGNDDTEVNNDVKVEGTKHMNTKRQAEITTREAEMKSKKESQTLKQDGKRRSNISSDDSESREKHRSIDLNFVHAKFAAKRPLHLHFETPQLEGWRRKFQHLLEHSDINGAQTEA